MAKSLQYYDVFVPGGYPIHTYNPRSTLSLEESIHSVMQNLCKLVVVTGHTKSGKTVLVQKILPREDSVWIDGGGINDEEDLWTNIIDQLELFQGIQMESKTSVGGEVSSEVSAEGGVIVAKGGVKAAGKVSGQRDSSSSHERSISSRTTALTGLRNSRTPLVIDDFHYLPKDMQGDVIRALKPLVFAGVPVVVIAIPHRRYDAVKVEREMTGRILSVNVPTWDEDELGYIPRTGFPLLDFVVPSDIVKQLAAEAIGSPHLMQEFCRALCQSSPDTKSTLRPGLNTKAIFHETAETTIGRPIFEKLARGPRQRSDRIQRGLKSGGSVDIYGLILGGLAHIKPGLITLEYEDLRTAIREICVPENIPNLQEVARVLKHMAEISATDESSTPVIDFDEDEKRLHITDPFFAFYLRWGNISK